MVNKGVYFFQNANNLNLKLFLGIYVQPKIIYSIIVYSIIYPPELCRWVGGVGSQPIIGEGEGVRPEGGR